MDRVTKQAELFSLPETQIPHSIIAFGYPKEKTQKKNNFTKKVVFILKNSKKKTRQNDLFSF